jgi:hypothetical protein
MKTLELTVYTFDELSEKAKERARDWFREASSSDKWWEHIYEDAARAGLTIQSFDLDRHEIEGEFKYFGGAVQCAALIRDEHGKDCETYKTATAFLEAIGKFETECAEANGDDSESDDYDTWQDRRGELEADFLRSILEDYRIMLRKELDFTESNEHVDECMQINKYTFTKDGKREG